ncbi:hypothetical protein JTE90_018740 [Oedothorax gibbosus]|uniref:Uncharacterized protein n=1 Tax=Oedothorax gibbosus TaxID=931172 RepID=A0AAV6TGL6_9ARAC|nr:hypothetical protein JTE90_018740 [Oedothorax gibbosus]
MALKIYIISKYMHPQLLLHKTVFINGGSYELYLFFPQSSSGARAAAVEPLEESGADSQLRVTLLWLAASMADLHALILYTAGHPQMKEISKVYTKVLSREWTVGDLSCEVLRFCRNRLSSNSHASPQLFSQIIGRQASSSMSQESLD